MNTENTECGHQISFPVYSPHTVTMGGWSRKADYRTVKIYFDSDQRLSDFKDDNREEYIHLKGAWKVEGGSMNSIYTMSDLKDMKYCPRCGENIQSKEEQLP